MIFGDSASAYFLTWRHGYNRALFKSDLIAGLTVGVVLIPQGMAYALLAGVPPVYGLYASLVPLIVYTFLGSSRQLAVGVVAIDSLVVAAGVGALAAANSESFLGHVLLLALMVGVIQLAMGLLRFGFVVSLLSKPVITGFTAAAAIIIGMSQLQHLMGLSLGRNLNVFILLSEAFSKIEDVQMASVMIGLGGIVLLIAMMKWLPRVPGPLIVVLVSAFMVYFTRLDSEGVAIVGSIPAGLPAPSFPPFSYESIRELFPTAVTLSLIQFMGVMSLGKVFATKNGYRVQPNQELIALGTMNLAGSAFLSIPVSGSYSRSAVNDRAGAKSPLANGIAALLILCTLLFLTPFFYYLPIPIFASIIMVAAFSLVNIGEVRFLLKTKAVDGVIALVTFFATLILGIEQGMLVGVSLSIVAIMYRIGRPNVAILGHLPGSRSFRDVNNHRQAHQFEGIVLIRIDASFSFANADLLQDAIQEHTIDKKARAVILDASSVNDLDTTALSALADLNQVLRAKNISFYFASFRQKSLDMLESSGTMAEMDPSHFFLSADQAVLHVLTLWGREREYLDRIAGQADSDSA